MPKNRKTRDAQRSGGSCSPPRGCAVSLAPRLRVAASGTFGTSQKVVMSSLCKRLGFALVKPALFPAAPSLLG